MLPGVQASPVMHVSSGSINACTAKAGFREKRRMLTISFQQGHSDHLTICQVLRNVYFVKRTASGYCVSRATKKVTIAEKERNDR